MIIKSDELKDVASKVLSAIDNNELSTITETLSLVAANGILTLAVTNKEYYAEVKLKIADESEFKASVNATLFLNLISQTTTEDIQFEIKDQYLFIKGNGSYKLPLIYDGDKLLELPKIHIENPTVTMSIQSVILRSILDYNSKELQKGHISNPVQKYFYVDEKGAITFTTGACVNNFELSSPVRILLNQRIVKLFKLFKDSAVNFTLGYDAISDEIIQTKVRFETADISITAILSCDDTMLNSVPVAGIRGRATNVYPYSCTISRAAPTETISRLMLFVGKDIVKQYSTFEFHADKVIVWDVSKENKEEIPYANNISGMTEPYVTILDLVDIKLTLDACDEDYLQIKFGDDAAIVISRGSVSNVIPVCSEV